MKHTILFCLLSLSCLYASAMDRKEAIRIADEFMFSGRQHILSKCDYNILEFNQLFIINYLYSNQEFGFVIVGRSDNLPSPILAFSPTGRIKHDNSTMRKLLESYTKEIKAWNDGNLQLSTDDSVYYQREKSTCLPLLKEISWHQNKPYNNGMPSFDKKKKYQSGCAAIAVGQIMKYYEYPSQGIGKGSYTQTNDKGETYSIKVDYDSLQIDWSKIKDRHEPQETARSLKNVTSLIYHCAVAAGAKFSENVTTGYVTPLVKALYQNFGYDPSVRTIRKNEMSGPELYQLFYREVEAQRPVLCCGLSHFFVCDGFADEYIHINWGWGGAMDGYFKLSALGAKADKINIFDDVIVNLYPAVLQEEKHKTVQLSQPGELCRNLSDEEARSLTSLEVVGKLNGKDICLIQKMAGTVLSVWDNGGRLSKLDLSKAEIVADTVTPYYKENLTNAKFVKTMTRRNSTDTERKTFNFATMDDKEWEKLCQIKGDRDNRNHTWKYMKEGKEYYVHYYLTDHTINSNMFKNCANLQEIILPELTQEIQPRAFANCKSLQRMSIPAQTSKLSPAILSGCISMESVTVSPSNTEYRDIDGIVYSKDSTVLVYYPPSKTDSVYIMPQSVTHLRSNAFSESVFLRTVQLSDNLKQIPLYAFYNCPQIESIRIPESVETIAPMAFFRCKKLTTVQFPSKLQNLGDDIMVDCGNK